jgi:serine phosphatase RsbU (regulator of sigma subunit)
VCFSEDDSLNICLGDATGHGMKAGIMVSSMKSIFTTNAPKMDIESFFTTANSGVKSMNLKRMMMGFVMININKNVFKMINAGMPPIFLYRKNVNAVDEIIAHGMPIGAMSHSNYVVSDLCLEKNDVILLMSDGMPELQNENNEMYGYKRIRDSFQKVAEKSPEEIIEYLKDEGSVWVNDEDPDDDVTFVVIKVK